MDKLMNNHWFVKIMALLLALLLYLSVNIDPEFAKNASSGGSTVNYETEMLQDVPVNVYYDSENTTVKGIPTTVDVILNGPKSILQPTKLQRDFEIYVDLTNLQLGTHKVKLKHRNISEKLDVKIDPQSLTVVMEEKVSRTVPVEADVTIASVREGYITEQPIVKPASVKIVGAKSEVERVDRVKAALKIDEAYETVETQVKLTALDKRSNKVSVDIQPQTVSLTVPVVSPSKKVPLKINTTGALPEGVQLKNIALSPNEVTVYGSKEKLDKLSILDDIEIDLSKVSKSKSVWVDVPIPKGAKGVSPERVLVQIEVEQEGQTEGSESEKRLLEGIPLSLTGKSSSFTYQLLSPKTEDVNIEIEGPSSVLSDIQPGDIQLSINVKNLAAGEHEVPIEVKVPQAVTYELSLKESKVKIMESSNNNNTESETEDPPQDVPDNPVDKNENSYDDQNISNIQLQG
jgi:YbbR domain-containing protein